jgi:L-ascorbate metabolism protein UlaG (beta-lactamase superfamily)
MIKPVLQEDAFLSDIKFAATDTDRLHLWWLGQSGYLIQWQGRHLLMDPYLSDSLTKKYAGTDKPHIRMTERVISPERLDFIDVVASTHNHTDHLDGETLIPLLRANPKMDVIVSRANIGFAANRIKVPPERLTAIRVGSSPLTIGPFALSAIPSAHESLETDEQGDYKCIGFIVEVGGRTIYHSGDCLMYNGLAECLKHWKIDIAFLPINGRDPSRGVPGNFDSRSAASLGKAIDAGMVIPCHYEMFEFNTVPTQGFAEAAESIGLKYHLLKCSERLDF